MIPEAVDTALDATAMVGTFIRRMREEIGESDVIIKGDESPVTIVDVAAQVLMRINLEEDVRVPALPMCGEESREILLHPDSERFRSRVLELVQAEKPSIGDAEMRSLLDRGSYRAEAGSEGTFWICDPIDGTRRYLSGHRYSSCLALLLDGCLACGAIACPDLGAGPDDPVEARSDHGSLYCAVAGGGAHAIEGLDTGSSGRRTRLRLPDRSDRDPVVRVARSVGSSDLRPKHVWDVLEANGAVLRTVPIDNQCKYVALATNRVDCLYKHAGSPDSEPGWVWDFAPGVLLASESGAEVHDRDGRPFDFDQGPKLLRNRGLAANGPGIRGFFSTVG